LGRLRLLLGALGLLLRRRADRLILSELPAQLLDLLLLLAHEILERTQALLRRHRCACRHGRADPDREHEHSPCASTHRGVLPAHALGQRKKESQKEPGGHRGLVTSSSTYRHRFVTIYQAP